MAFEQVRMKRPLSRLELAIAAAVLFLCAGWFLQRMNRASAAAEATALELTIRNARTGLLVVTAGRLLDGDQEGLAALDRANPVGTVISAPPGYIGELRGAQSQSIQPGQWYFDLDQGWLAYHVVHGDHVAAADGQAPRLRLQLRLGYRDANGNGVFDAGLDKAEGITLKVLDELHWEL